MMCSECKKPYTLTNFMVRFYINDETSKGGKTDTHMIKHYKEQGLSIRVLSYNDWMHR
jgi:hypothetical protein